MAIIGLHALIYSKNADADRAFFQKVLSLRSVDAGGGWPIFAAPPAELAVHPAEDEAYHELFLMCDDLKQTIADLKTKGIATGKVTTERYGHVTTITMPSGAKLGLYQPTHPTAIKLK